MPSADGTADFFNLGTAVTATSQPCSVELEDSATSLGEINIASVTAAIHTPTITGALFTHSVSAVATCIPRVLGAADDGRVTDS